MTTIPTAKTSPEHRCVGASRPALELATMNEWWRLTDRYPRFRAHSHTLLKDYGYMRLMDLVDAISPQRLLEFGHGFNPTLLSYAQTRCETHALDDDMNLPYFPTGKAWEELYDETITPACTECHLHRGLLGGSDSHNLAAGSFDLIASVSVLEELEPSVLRAVVADCARLLSPGGVIAGTFDLMLKYPHKLDPFADACERAGLELGTFAANPKDPDWNELLLESPSCVMCTYQMSQPENRRYAGHWTAVWFVARKPA